MMVIGEMLSGRSSSETIHCNTVMDELTLPLSCDCENSKGAFLFSQAILPKLLEEGDRTHPPSLIFTGMLLQAP